MRYLMLTVVVCGLCLVGINLEDAKADASAIPFRTDKKVSVGCGVGKLNAPDYKLYRLPEKWEGYFIGSVDKKGKADWWETACGVNFNVTDYVAIRGIGGHRSDTGHIAAKAGFALSRWFKS